MIGIIEGDEVQLSEGRFAGYYATVIELDEGGIEALVEFPDRSRSVAAASSLVLVLRPAPAEPVDEGIDQ